MEEKNTMGNNIGGLVGKNASNTPLSEAEVKDLSQRNSDMRRFGFGPYVATFRDDRGNERPLGFHSSVEREVQGAALTVRSILMARRARHINHDRLDALNNRLKKYIGSQRKIDFESLTRLDPATITITIVNRRRQVIFRA